MPINKATRPDDGRLIHKPGRRKSGPKPKDNTVKRVLISIEPDLLTQFDQCAAMLGQTRSEFFRNAAMMALEIANRLQKGQAKSE